MPIWNKYIILSLFQARNSLNITKINGSFEQGIPKNSARICSDADLPREGAYLIALFDVWLFRDRIKGRAQKCSPFFVVLLEN
jgi:hypothetical protein